MDKWSYYVNNPRVHDVIRDHLGTILLVYGATHPVIGTTYLVGVSCGCTTVVDASGTLKSSGMLDQINCKLMLVDFMIHFRFPTALIIGLFRLVQMPL